MSAYFDAIDEQIDALTRATGLPWEHDDTGGGHDALFVYFDHPDDYGKESPRVAYVMLTCDASVVDIGRDRHACLGFFPDSHMWTDSQAEATIGDEYDPRILTLDDLCNFVGQWLRRWGVI
jgi:hypothetical protein